MAFPDAAVSKRGLLIVIEGLDRSGKSSQCQRLFDFFRLQGQRVRYVKFPGLSLHGQVCSWADGHPQTGQHQLER